MGHEKRFVSFGLTDLDIPLATTDFWAGENHYLSTLVYKIVRTRHRVQVMFRHCIQLQVVNAETWKVGISKWSHDKCCKFCLWLVWKLLGEYFIYLNALKLQRLWNGLVGVLEDVFGSLRIQLVQIFSDHARTSWPSHMLWRPAEHCQIFFAIAHLFARQVNFSFSVMFQHFTVVFAIL